ncbi:MAG: phosphonopyruvate decarboxylase [Mucispirillum sp.]|nr:phosphonopyruvate decarboxylase [Mucispirillum sp.]
MISPEFFYNLLDNKEISFFTGVPDSLLKSFCAYVTDHKSFKENIIAANEGNAVCIAAGYYSATGKIPLVYMQNSGEGNIVNPILSMADKELYSIPMLLLIGWRGEPGTSDEPQHIKQGRVTLNILDSMEIKYEILENTDENVITQIERVSDYLHKHKEPFALIVKKNTFGEYKLQNKIKDKYAVKREDAIKHIISCADDDSLFISTTGMISRELYELREMNNQSHHADLLVVGAMGHASSIALGAALNTSKQIYCLDGDGAVLMHMGALSIIGSIKPKNLCHIVLNNGAHDSVGGQPTVAFNVDLCQIAKSCNYEYIERVDTLEKIKPALKNANNKCSFIEIMVSKGNRSDLGRPKQKPCDNLNEFMKKF